MEGAGFEPAKPKRLIYSQLGLTAPQPLQSERGILGVMIEVVNKNPLDKEKILSKLSNEFRSKGYGFDVTNLTPENVDKIIDLMKKHNITANKIAEKIIEQGSY